MPVARREIYSIAFNKSLTSEGLLRMKGYQLGVMSENGMRVPEKITLVKDKVIVLFTDKSRHIIHYNSDVEIFDRIVEPKKKEK